MVSLGVPIYAFVELFFYDHTYAKYLNILLWALDLDDSNSFDTDLFHFVYTYDMTVVVYVVT